MERLTRFVLRHRRLVVGGWLLVFLVSVAASSRLSSMLTNRFTLPGTDTYRAEGILHFGQRSTGSSGRLVTAAGLIMFAAFMGFVAGSIVGLQQFGLGLAAAILIDVTIVRALLVPSAMKLFGKGNWWMPEGLARIARIDPSPLGEHHPVFQPGAN